MPSLYVEGVLPGDSEQLFTIPSATAPSAYLAGVVVGPGGEPVAGLKVWVSDIVSQWNYVFPVSSEDGAFRLGPLVPGEFSLTAVDHRNRWPSRELATVHLAIQEEHHCGTHRLGAAAPVVIKVDRGVIAGSTRLVPRSTQRMVPT